MIKAHVIRLFTTEPQETFFKKSCGTARFAYNWALSQWKIKFEAKEKTSAYLLIKELTAIKKDKYSWMLDVGKTCPQYAIHNLESAFKKFFKKTAKYPKFKRKGIKDSFVAIENELSFKQQDYKIWIPRLGWVKCAENLRFEGKVNNVTIKRIADYWFAVVNIDLKSVPIINENQVIIGVDLGLKHLAVTSDGVVYDNPKALKKRIKSLKRQQRSLSRKVKGSNNKKKQQMKVAKLHYKVSCVRKDAIHKATTDIVNKAGVIVIEDLNVKGMTKNHNLAQSLNDASFGEFRRQVEYKAAWQGKEVVVADRFYPSSKTCNHCGWVNVSLKLNQRTFKCNVCGNEIDRDLNAAKNLARYGSTLRLRESNAFGERSSITEMQYSLSVKEEIKHINNNEHLFIKFNEL